MQYEYFGLYLRELRESRNMTRDQLANNICSPKQIYRIEKGDYEPSLYLLNQLSIKFNLDLNTYYKMHYCNRSITAYEVIKTFEAAVNNRNIDEIIQFVNTYKSHKDFKDGINSQYIYHGQALITLFVDRNLNECIQYCIKGILVDIPNFTIDTVSKFFYSNASINMISLISMCYYRSKEYNCCIQILKDLLYSLEYFVFNSPLQFDQITDFIKSFYQKILFNLSMYLFDCEQLEDSLYYVEKGIRFANQMNNIRCLPELFTVKLHILLRHNDLTNALITYNKTVTLLDITEQPQKIIELNEYIKEHYPKLKLE